VTALWELAEGPAAGLRHSPKRSAFDRVERTLDRANMNRTSDLFTENVYVHVEDEAEHAGANDNDVTLDANVVGSKRKRKASSQFHSSVERSKDPPRPYRPWGFKDDFEVCTAVVEKGMGGMMLRPAWFDENKVLSLSDRTTGSLCNRYKRALQQPLFEAVQKAKATGQPISYEWLEQAHQSTQKNPFYSVEEDISLCRLICAAFPPGKPFDKSVLSVQWFQANAASTKDEGIAKALKGRDAMSMYHRRQKYLDHHLANAINNRAPGADPDLSFLATLHGKDWDRVMADRKREREEVKNHDD